MSASWSPKLPGDWATHAACNDHPRITWFPDHHDTPAINAAKRVCDGCPVRHDCLEFAQRVGERWGIWGGLTPDERNRGERVLGPIVHGTDKGYAAHRRRREPPCAACRAAHAVAGHTYKISRAVG